jgi:predicted metal-dependent peptidase
MTPVTKRLMTARTALVLQEPFFGTLALHLRIREGRTKTASVDGSTLTVNPEWVAGLSHEQATSLIAQAVLHCAMGHPWRRDGRDLKRWNQACHIAISDVLSEAGFVLPNDAPRPTSEQHGKSAEWIYDRLPETQENENGKSDDNGSGQQPGNSGGQPDHSDSQEDAGDDTAPGSACAVSDAPQESDHTETTEAEWQQIVQQAATAAKGRGSLPSGLERFAIQVAQPRVDWRSVLRRFAQQITRNDYSFRRPNTRYLARGLYLPALHNEEAGPLAACVDTSASIDDVLLDQSRIELQVILDDIRPSALYIIYCDADVQRIDVFRPGDTLEFRPIGGGGTDFAPALRACEQLDDPPVCAVYLTDLDGPCDYHPEFPVLWISTTDREGPFGETVRIS